MQTKRPIRISLESVQGKKLSLNSGVGAFSRLDANDGQEHIILGLGPLVHEDGLEFALPSTELLNARKVYYVECAEFSAAVQKQGGQANIPEHFQKISMEDLPSLIQGRAIWWYKQNMYFYPDFWAHAFGMVQAELLRGQGNVAASKVVFVAGGEQLLLHREVCMGFEELGFIVRTVQDDLENLLKEEQPSLFFSVNLRGLDAEGATFSLLKALGIPVAIWFVDNPWHILSALRLPWWKDATLFMTDASFVEGMKEHGAREVYHLPLAASQHMWNARKAKASEAALRASSAACVFVGRAAFPDNAKFFAAAKVPEHLLKQSFELVEQGMRPHFHWWQGELGFATWPGHEVRNVGLGAEECSCRQRVLWLENLLPLRPVIFGDSEAWQGFLAEASSDTFYPNLDYYAELAEVYASAHCVLNVTSLLLPAGLTQRHFDVWAAGGFLFSDATAGLDIFPQELTEPMRVEHPSMLMGKILNLDLADRSDIIVAWQEHIRAEHSYAKRMSFVLDVVN